MKNRKRILTSLLISLCMVLLLAACGTNNNNATVNGKPDNQPANTSVNAPKDEPPAELTWAEENGLNKTETVEELYEQAKKEGKVVVYSQSSRIKNVKETFEAQYPGVTVEGYDMDTTEILEKVIREQAAGVYKADVVFVKDALGAVSTELTTNGNVHKYMPEDIISKQVPEYTNGAGIIPYVSLRVIYYNTDVYKTSPITNWWDLTEPEWKSRILINDPLDSSDMMELFMSMVKNSEEMAAAYKDKYGSDVVLSKGNENAGYEFLARLLANDPILVNDSDAVVENVGTAGQVNPPIGIGASSKLRLIEEKKLSIAATFDVKPKIGVVGPSYLFVADKAPNPAAAKLMIRWMAGEADGKGLGIQPYNVLGSWVTRKDIEHPNPFNIDEINAWQYDSDYYYKNSPAFRDFWLQNI